MRRLSGLLLALPLVALAVPAAANADAQFPPPGICVTSGPLVCFIDESHTAAVTVPASTDVTYARFFTTVQNNASSTVTHFRITEKPFAGASIAGLTGTDAAGRTVTCDRGTGACPFGNLPAKGIVTIEAILALTPAAAASDGINRFVLSFDEGTNDNPSNSGGKTDFMTLPVATTLLPRDGTRVVSYLPAGGAPTTLTTDQGGKAFAPASSAQDVVGTTEIPANLSAPVVGAVQRSAAAGPCPTLPCAMKDDWLQVSVPDFAGLSPAYLRTTVRVDAGLVANLRSSNPKNLTVHYTPDGTAAKLTTLPYCTFTRAGAPAVLGCYTAVKEKDGDLTVSVYERHNGFIRL